MMTLLIFYMVGDIGVLKSSGTKSNANTYHNSVLAVFLQIQVLVTSGDKTLAYKH